MNKRYRLCRTEDFERVRQEGVIYRHPFLVLSLSPNKLRHNRYGFITSKKLGNAVVRNRVRRLLRESVRLLQPDLKTGFDVVIIARRQIVGQPFAKVKETATAIFRRAMIVEEGHKQ